MNLIRGYYACVFQNARVRIVHTGDTRRYRQPGETPHRARRIYAPEMVKYSALNSVQTHADCQIASNTRITSAAATAAIVVVVGIWLHGGNYGT